MENNIALGAFIWSAYNLCKTGLTAYWLQNSFEAALQLQFLYHRSLGWFKTDPQKSSWVYSRSCQTKYCPKISPGVQSMSLLIKSRSYCLLQPSCSNIWKGNERPYFRTG